MPINTTPVNNEEEKVNKFYTAINHYALEPVSYTHLKASIPFSELADRLTTVGQEMGLTIHTMHEDIFNSMHHV